METLIWILAGGFLMSALALVGGVTAAWQPGLLERALLPLVAMGAGTLLGSAFFHMIPKGTVTLTPLDAATWLVCGFAAFLGLEQFLHWHHSHSKSTRDKAPFTYLILLGDGLHNFVGGLAIGSTFLISPQAGIVAWMAAAAHEVPQELGDFGVLVHGGWPRRQALAWNALSALTFPLGGVIAFLLASQVDVAVLVLFGAGNFIYIAASDLIPEIKARGSLGSGLLHYGCFLAGLVLMFALAYRLQH